MLIRRSVLMRKYPFAIAVKDGLQIIIWIIYCVTWRAISNFDIHHILAGSIDKIAGISGASSKACTHPGREFGFALICNERWIPFQNVDEFILH